MEHHHTQQMYMNTPVNRALLILAAHCLFQLGFANASEAVADGTFVRSFLDTHCIRCHGEKKSKGDVTLHKLSTASKAATDLSVWKKVFEQLESGEMPPEESKQPTTAGREQVLIWIKNTLKAGGGSVDEFRVLASAHGNWVDHDALFSGKAFGESGTLGRVWRLTPGGYLSIIIRLNKELNLGLNDVRSSNGLSIRAPWALARKWDFQDYSAALRLTEPELDHHLNNCIQIAESMVPRIAKGGSPLKKVQALLTAGKAATSEQVEAAVIEMFDYVLHLQLEPAELRKYSQALTADLQSRDATKAVTRFVVQVLHHPEMLFRVEKPVGTATRSLMSPHQLARSIAFGLTDSEPDPAIWQAAAEGKLTSGADVRRQVERILNDPQIPKPRILRFFQEYFGYHLAEGVSKERVTLETKLGNKATNLDQFPSENFTYDTDRLVEWVLASDKQVLRTLLTTQKTFFLAKYSDDMDRTEARLEFEKKRDAEIAARDNKPFDPDAPKYKLRREEPGANVWPLWLQIYGFVTEKDKWYKLVSYDIAPPPSGVGLDFETWYKNKGGPFDFPPNQRMGILTQPSWLVAMSSNFDNHAIHRGRWIRERMLGGRVPEVPITVNAMLPEEPHNGLRERMRVTREEYCWKCHKSMDPLGLVFEQYDHVGRYREKEIVVDKEKTEAEKKRNPGALDIMKLVPFDTTGAITDSGDPKLDGPVNGPFEFIKKLVESERVEQVFVRHVFRYFLGRNETLADGPVLVAAHKAYRDSNGSFKALLVSLLTSDAFLYRTAPVLAKNFP